MYCRASITVGRGADMQIVEDALFAARHGHGRAVALVGEPGIGKTRLAAEAAGLAGRAGMRVLRGRGSGIGSPVPFRPITEALLSWQRGPDAPDPDGLGPYRPLLGRLVPDWGPAPTDGDTSPVVLAEAVLRLLARSATRAGFLMVLDDFHDADPESLAVVEYLMDNLNDQPTALLCAVRDTPSAALDLVRATAQRGLCTPVELARLGRDDVRGLMGSCLRADVTALADDAVDVVWADSAGNPYVAEELIGGLIDSGRLGFDGGRWRLTGASRPGLPQTTVPMTVARAVSGRLEALRPTGRALLSAAAILGRRFPVTVAQGVAGLADPTLGDELRTGVAAQLIRLDEEPGWYQFHHPLMAEAVLTRLTPHEQAVLARTTADLIEARFPGLPGQWCQLAASLRLRAGDPVAAGRLFGEAGRRALAAGAANSAVDLLGRAQDLLATDADPNVRASVLDSKLAAMTEAGLVEQALVAASTIDDYDGLGTDLRAALHTRLAAAAAMTGRTAEGFAQAHRARTLLGPSATPAQLAPIDVVTARLIFDAPGRDRLVRAASLLRQAAVAAESGSLPVVACQAWQLLGSLVRSTDPDEARTCLERAHAIAVRHDLAIADLHILVRLGGLDALTHGDLERLERARRTSLDAGAVVVHCELESTFALWATLFGDFATAVQKVDEVVASASRLKLAHIAQYGLMIRAILAGHRGRRREMDAATAEFDRWGGIGSHHAPQLYGLGRAVCALLEEDRPRAVADLERAVAIEVEQPTPLRMYGRYGLGVLLAVLDGRLDQAGFDPLVADPACGQRWNLHFVTLAEAVLLGRAGRQADAAAAVRRAAVIGEPFRMARWLGLRLICDAAIADRWGDPAGWLAGAEQYFHDAGIVPVARACRALLRRTGKPVNQRRNGYQDIPGVLRSAGVTPREYEVLRLVAHRHANRVIADRLHISPRTVEKHVASLLMKTGQPDRTALGEYTRTFEL